MTFPKVFREADKTCQSEGGSGVHIYCTDVPAEQVKVYDSKYVFTLNTYA